MFYDAAYRASPNATGRMFCGRLLISPHPVAAHHSTSSSATLNSRPHRYSRGLPRPEVRGLCHSRGQYGQAARLSPRKTARPETPECTFVAHDNVRLALHPWRTEQWADDVVGKVNEIKQKKAEATRQP